MGESLTTVIGALSSLILQESSAQEVCNLVAHYAVEVVPAASDAAVSLVHDGHEHPPVVATVGGNIAAGELAQIDGVARETLPTWFTRTGRGLPHGSAFRDLVVVPMILNSGWQGSLAVYSLSRQFEEQSIAAAVTLAQHSCALIANALAFEELKRTNINLQTGLRTRELVGLAKGILMKEESCSEEEAFRILARSSQRLNRKVRDVAEHIVALTEGRIDLARDRRV
jgi:GAF domain-containing protein